MYAVFPKPIHSGTSFVGWLDSWLVDWLVGYFFPFRVKEKTNRKQQRGTPTPCKEALVLKVRTPYR